MYIGASYDCKEYCEEQDKRKFQKYHGGQRHTVLEVKSFTEDNKDFMRKSKRAWNAFQIRLQSFFKKLKNQIEFIENQAYERLEYQEVTTAISTNDKYLARITTDIMQERYRNLSCQDIDQFLQLRKRREHSHLDIGEEEYQFAQDIVRQLKETFKEITHDFKEQSYHPRKTQIDRPIPKFRKEIEPKKYTKTPKYAQQNINRYQREEDRQSQASRSTQNRERYDKKQKKKYFGKPQQNKKCRKEPEHQRFQYKNEESNEGHCPTLTIKELSKENNAFDIELKLVNFLKKLGSLEVWRASDDTGQIKLIIPHHRYLKGGTTIKLTNCYIKEYNRSFEICTNATSTISSHDLREEKLNHHYNRNNNPNRTIRYDRSDRSDKQGKNLIKIDEIEPNIEHLKLIAKVVKVESSKNGVVSRYVLGDETGIVSGEFEGFESLLKENSVFYLRGLEAKVDKKGHLYLTGKKMLVEPAYDEIKAPIKESNNISTREYEQVQEQTKK